ncbi:lysosomal alpha-glucosidase-like isoform X1 [Dermacentor variabilis]|uniref:lysosomal alpha-glucosidase-like isoform X1 n=1 Tax=Dermacentor variabilis TaxID=34621 RepID=UPI003F5B7D9A
MLRESRAGTFVLRSFLWMGVIAELGELAVSAERPTEIDSNGYDEANRCLLESIAERFDCHPEPGATRDACSSRGCCWSPLAEGAEPSLVPHCYFARDHSGYQVVGTATHDDRVSLRLKRHRPSGVDVDIQKVDVDVMYYDRDTVRIRVTDAAKERFVPPVPRIPFRTFAGVRDYSVNVSTSGVITVNRSGTNIFHTDLSRLVFTDRFLQLSTLLPSDVLYGLGQHWGPLRRSLNWTSQILFNKDRPVMANKNLYGSHPFYLVVERGGLSHGVFLHNSNFMEALLQPAPAVTFRALGGVLDLFLFVGPTPSKVVQQYQRVVGFPAMPPYWSLGFHLCRYGYENLNNTREIMQNNVLAGIPLDAQWNDIDSMERRNAFTYDKEAFAGLPEFVREVHAGGRRYVLIFDPAVSGSETPGMYPPYDDGVEMDIFVKNTTGGIKNGKVWNENSSVFPDFSHPLAGAYWTKQFRRFHDVIPFDGAWIDMNEPANFENFHEGDSGCPPEEVANPPPYVPGDEALSNKTLCMTDRHHLSSHYDLHNVYAHLEAILTYRALAEIRGKRPFIISRSTSPGQGSWSGQWSGDTDSSWDHLRLSVPSMLSFSLYGIPMTGSDICGFFKDSNEEMCARWFELGAFYPFSRSHNMNGSVDQDPHSMGPVVVEVAKNALETRYTLLPYLYTLFYRSHVYGETVARPLFFEFPEDPNTYDIDQQFLWGSSLLFNPVLYENQNSVRTYVPRGVWYGLDANGSVYHEAEGGYHQLESPLRTIKVLVRGGSIIPCQLPAPTTEMSRRNPLSLVVAPDERGTARGELFWDDGDSIDTVQRGQYDIYTFMLIDRSQLVVSATHHGYAGGLYLGTVAVFGIQQKPAFVSLKGRSLPFRYNDETRVLTIVDIWEPLAEAFVISWST